MEYLKCNYIRHAFTGRNFILSTENWNGKPLQCFFVLKSRTISNLNLCIQMMIPGLVGVNLLWRKVTSAMPSCFKSYFYRSSFAKWITFVELYSDPTVLEILCKYSS